MGEDDGLPEHWQKPLEQMSTQANRMNAIVADLLELSRLESSGAAPADEYVDVCGLLAAAKKSFHGQGRIASIEVDCQSSARLLGSTSEIESVIVNLLSNAIRYTSEDGSIVLRWNSSDDFAELTVVDTGIGIEEEHLSRLTERFFRVDPGRSRAEGGIGLGLAIVKHILERHDAVLHVSSVVGEGSEFCCRFPESRISLEDPIPIAGGT